MILLFASASLQIYGILLTFGRGNEEAVCLSSRGPCLYRQDESNIEEQLIEVPMESEEKGFTEDFKGRKRAAIARRNRAAQYDMLRRKAMGGYGSKARCLACPEGVKGQWTAS